MKDLLIKLKHSLMKISLVDRFLMLFMLILLVYTAVNLFTGASAPKDSNTIDIIVRTSSAAIFGYFVSNNFVKADSSVSIPISDISEKTLTVDIENQIPSIVESKVDAVSLEPEFLEPSYGKIALSPKSSCNKIQVIIVSIIGISSLILLFIAKIFVDITPEVVSTISQLRDFVFTCLGFLMSCVKMK